MLPDEVESAELHERPLPSFRVPPATSCPRPPSAPSEEEQEAFKARFPDESSVWTSDGWGKLKKREVAMWDVAQWGVRNTAQRARMDIEYV